MTAKTHQPYCDACKQQIIFIRMTATGRGLPCDPYPVADGNVCATPSGRGLSGFVIAKDKPAVKGWQTYAAHFGTCPARARPGQTKRATPTHETQTLPIDGIQTERKQEQ